MAITWTYKSFDKLTAAEIYAIMQLRNEVFVVEQNCIYQDADNKDINSFHLCGWNENLLVTYCRILPPGLSSKEASIGRVLTKPAYRKSGYGKALMQIAIEKTLSQYNTNIIVIGAQLYLQHFYKSLGFKKSSKTYLEDGIPHISMTLVKNLL